MTALQAPETKSAEAAAFDEYARVVEAYKETNDARLAEIEARLSPDVVSEEKLARINEAVDQAHRRIDRVTLDARRPALGAAAADARDPAVAEHKRAFQDYVRTGEAAGLKRLEAKALSAGSGPDGGYLVPDTVEREVLRRLANISPIRAVASVRTISGGLYKRAFSTAGPATGWVGETAARPQTNASVLAELSYPTMELYAQPAATQTLLDDAIVDIDQWIADEVESAFAEQEGAAFVGGDGVNKPKGFLASTTVDNASWSWGNLGFIGTGAAGAFPASNPSDKLIELIYALRAGYRQNAVFVMNRKTQSAIRKFKDADGNYLWQPPAGAGQGATLMSFPVVEAEDMPDIGANSLSIAFGDFRRLRRHQAPEVRVIASPACERGRVGEAERVRAAPRSPHPTLSRTRERRTGRRWQPQDEAMKLSLYEQLHHYRAVAPAGERVRGCPSPERP
jgi:HK97 family phage major capsid protein